MNNRHNILNRYFSWLIGLVCDEYQQQSYSQLLSSLHDIEFIWMIDNDENRAADGIDLRATFSEKENIDFYECRRVLNGPCSVLEMMVGLACRCEDSIMGNEKYGDRTSQWFWIMIHNLELDDMDNIRYDDEFVRSIIESALYRTYNRSGKGGFFYVENGRRNFRKAEIWYQMCWYLDTIEE